MEKEKLPENNLENATEMPIQTTEIVDHFSAEALGIILKLEKECFPADWQYENADGYYKKILEDPENINIFLKDGNEVVGYVLAKFHNIELEELKGYDSELKEREGFYVETIQILPEFLGRGGVKKLLFAICGEAKKRGVEKFSIHVRTINGFHDKIKKIFEGKITAVRKIEHWGLAAGEPYEYIEWEYKK
jgi:ribosomal protein S18 acetylase RimI-like enzyme